MVDVGVLRIEVLVAQPAEVVIATLDIMLPQSDEQVKYLSVKIANVMVLVEVVEP